MIESNTNDDDKAWRELTAAQFFRGYAPSDAIYDNFDARANWNQAANESDDQDWQY